MRILLLITLIFTGLLTSLNSFAGESQENIYLVQILNQLNAIQPLILAAQNEQPANSRMQFHYTKYRDAQGKLHNGLLEDVNAIKKGIEQKLNQTSIEPRTVAPVKGDYLNNH